jgi:hypothetical protein
MTSLRGRLAAVLCLGWVALACSVSARASDLEILPASIVLDGPRSSQRVLVESRQGDERISDETPRCRFAIDDPRVATVSPDGTVRPIADGKATLKVSVGDRTASAAIVVKNFGRDVAPSFKNDVLPILTRSGCNMGSCHGAAAGKNGLRLTLRGYAPEVDFDVLTRQSLGRRVNRTAPEESLLLLKPTGAIEHGGGVRFAVDSPEYRLLADWIAQGTPRPLDNEPTVARVTALPPSIRSSPGQKLDVIVQATYSDGRVADVTRWAKFGSTDETVAKVDEFGHVTVDGTGEAAVTVWFASLVDRLTVSVPSRSAVDPRVFADAPRRSPIDEINLAKLRTLGIPPSPETSDASFIRRAYLDATGTLPSATRVSAYLDDPDPEKRNKLVAEILASPEYVDYWAYKWSDLLLVSSKKLPAAAMWAFSRSIRESVEANVPWDEFARRIITAKGSTLTHGEANYFVLHRDPIDLTESASMAFLGMSLTCARCHNHPMEKWTQDQYYGMANLFSRVALKDGDRDEVIVSPAPDGEILHPRKGVAMAPQPLDAKATTIAARGDRRELFADWLASPENPYFDRAIVNRVWRNFFGRGLIEPEDDLRATNPASDEALLSWLVADFRAHHRDVKHVIRTIMTSSAYARSSDPIPGNEADAKFLTHYLAKRLPAEVLLDAISRVADVPTPFAGYPSGWRSIQLPDAQVANPFLSAFGRPERISTCSCERSSEPSVAQALNLANGSTLNAKLRDDNGAVSRLAASKAGDVEVVDALFLSALSRRPTDAERSRLAMVLADATAGIGDAKEARSSRRQAIEDLFWAVLTGKEFLFNH